MAEDQHRSFAGDAGNFAGDDFVEDELLTTPMVWRGQEATMSSRRVRSTVASGWRRRRGIICMAGDVCAACVCLSTRLLDYFVLDSRVETYAHRGVWCGNWTRVWVVGLFPITAAFIRHNCRFWAL